MVEVLVGRVAHPQVFGKQNGFQRRVSQMPGLNHAKAEMLPSQSDNAFQNWHSQASARGYDYRLVGVWLGALQPANEAGEKEWIGDVINHEHHTDRPVGKQLLPVGHEESFGEGQFVVRVFVKVILDIIFDLLLCVATFHAIRKVSILFEADLLRHRTFEERPGVPVGELIEETCVFSHRSTLEHFPDFLSRRIFLVSLV